MVPDSGTIFFLMLMIKHLTGHVFTLTVSIGFWSMLNSSYIQIPLLQIVNSTYTWPENINSECDLLSVFTSDPLICPQNFLWNC